MTSPQQGHIRRHIALMPGDGIGPEVAQPARRALDALNAAGLVDVQVTELDWPATDYHRRHGAMMPEDWRARLTGYDALLLGALGDPGPADDPARYYLPDHVSLAPLLAFRQGFDLWACERPARAIEGAPQYLADPRAAEVDMLVIRENSEGEYAGHGGRLARGSPREIVTQTSVFTRAGTERILRHAFERARQRARQRREVEGRSRDFGNGREAQVCLITKRNALAHWGELYTEVFEALAADYPEIATRHELIDAASMRFVTAPWNYDVVVASNLHGDILTDLAAVLGGGLGVAPSANLNPDDPAQPPLFEPTHGSAPDIAGTDRALPAGMLLATATLLEWLAGDDPQGIRAVVQLREAVEAELAAGTAEHGCRAFGEAVASRLA